MYYTQILIAPLTPFFVSDGDIKRKFNKLIKYGFLNKNLQPFKLEPS
jgi:hypothetical protein